MPLYRKRTVPFEAIQFTGSNAEEVAEMVQPVLVEVRDNKLAIIDELGEITLSVGDWIMKDSGRSLWPCSNEVFLRGFVPDERTR